MEGIVAFLIGVVDLNTVLGKDAHYVPMAAPSCDPKSIQTLFILLVDVDHFILEHEPHEFLTTRTNEVKSVTSFIKLS